MVTLMGAGSAAAQTPVVKPVQNPNPVVAPVAPMAQVLKPMVIDLPSLVDLDGISVVTRDAMDRARDAMSSVNWVDFQDGPGLTYLKGGDGYNNGKNLLAARKYEEAIAQFDRVVAQKTVNADGALYWKAYAQFKIGKTDDSVTTIGALRKDFPQSRYLGDAKVLEADARRRAGQPVNPASMDDDEMKVLAINGIKNTDPERAIPLLEGVLSSTNSLRVKKQALYVLASMPNQPKARAILMNYAKGAGNPDLQIEAIRYVVAGGDKTASTADLLQIFQSTQDASVRLAVISALRGSSSDGVTWMYSPGAAGTPTVVRSGSASGAAAKGPALTGADVWALYEKETNKEVKSALVSLMGSMGATDQVMRVVKADKDPDIVRRAIRSLGSQPTAKTGQTLIDLYSSEQDQPTRMAVIGALASQNNAEGLVSIARKEGSLALKKEIVKQLSEMAPRSKVAADYLMEIIK